MIRRVLAFVRWLRAEASKAAASTYRDGYTDALGEVEEFIVDREDEWDE